MARDIRLKFQDDLDRQLVRRTKELAQLNLLVKSERQHYEQDVINRLVIPHAYSHYEGFIKHASILFLKYIIGIYNPENVVPHNILALEIQKHMETGKSKSIVEYINLINIIREKQTHISFKPESVINTHSNLKSDVLKEIMVICDLRYDAYWQGKSLFIDNTLLRYRNQISHGELISLDIKTVIDCLSSVIEIIRTYKQKLDDKI